MKLLYAAIIISFALACSANAQVRKSGPSDDPLRHGYALLIGNYQYQDKAWPPLDDIPLQLKQLEKGLAPHFDKVEVIRNIEAVDLYVRIIDFVRRRGNSPNARLLIYYAGHGYTEIQRNENRGYITGIDTPHIDNGNLRSYDAARLKAISMTEIRAPLQSAPAQSILFIFDSCFAGTISLIVLGHRIRHHIPKILLTA